VDVSELPAGVSVYMGAVASAAEGGPPGTAGNAIQIFATSTAGIGASIVTTIEELEAQIATLAKTRSAGSLVRKAPSGSTARRGKVLCVP
jgi:hypothetical protein